MWKNDRVMFGHLFPVLTKTKMENPSDVFFLEVIPVIPPKFRPMNFLNGERLEAGLTITLNKVLKATYMMKTVLWAYKNSSEESLPEESRRLIQNVKGETVLDKLQNAWQDLQESVNMIADTSDNKEDKFGSGLRQVIFEI